MHPTARRQAPWQTPKLENMDPSPHDRQRASRPSDDTRSEDTVEDQVAVVWHQRCEQYLLQRRPTYGVAPKAYFNPGSPLFQATMPTANDIGHQAWQQMLPGAYLSPGNQLICLLYRLEHLLSSVAVVRGLDEGAQQLLRDVEMELLRRNPDAFVDVETFQEARYMRQRLAYEALRLTGLVLVCATGWLRSPTQMAASRQDHAIMQLFMIDMSALVANSPEVALWTFCIGGPLTSGFLRERIVEHLVDLMLRLRLYSWSQAREFLARQLYYPAIQDDACPPLWEEVERKAEAMDALRGSALGAEVEEMLSSPPEAPITPKRETDPPRESGEARVKDETT